MTINTNENAEVKETLFTVGDCENWWSQYGIKCGDFSKLTTKQNRNKNIKTSKQQTYKQQQQNSRNLKGKLPYDPAVSFLNSILPQGYLHIQYHPMRKRLSPNGLIPSDHHLLSCHKLCLSSTLYFLMSHLNSFNRDSKEWGAEWVLSNCMRRVQRVSCSCQLLGMPNGHRDLPFTPQTGLTQFNLYGSKILSCLVLDSVSFSLMLC